MPSRTDLLRAALRAPPGVRPPLRFEQEARRRSPPSTRRSEEISAAGQQLRREAGPRRVPSEKQFTATTSSATRRLDVQAIPEMSSTRCASPKGRHHRRRWRARSSCTRLAAGEHGRFSYRASTRTRAAGEGHRHREGSTAYAPPPLPPGRAGRLPLWSTRPPRRSPTAAGGTREGGRMMTSSGR